MSYESLFYFISFLLQCSNKAHLYLLHVNIAEHPLRQERLKSTRCSHIKHHIDGTVEGAYEISGSKTSDVRWRIESIPVSGLYWEA